MSDIPLKPDDLPPTWALTTLGTVVDYGRTTKAEPSQIADKDWVLELEDIEKDSSRLLQRVTFAQRQSKSTKNHFQAGDVLYGKLRPYLNKVLIADRAGYCTTEIVPIEAGSRLDNRYLFYWLKHPAFLKYVEAESHGMNMPRLGTDTGKAAPFVLAPTNEQTRIADQLDKLLARVQACNDRLDAIPALLKRFRQAVLSTATSGALTDASGFGIQAGWVDTTIGFIAVELRYGTSKKCDYSPKGTGVLRIPNIGEQGRIDVSDLKRAEFDGNELEKLRLCEGDLLVIRSNGSVELVGKTGLVTAAESGLLFAGYLMRLRVDPAKAMPAFIQLWLSSPAQRQYIERTAKSTSGVNNLNAEELRALPLRLPSLMEQAEIVCRVEALFALADRIEACYTAARAQAQRLTPLLLAKAFRGELAQQDPQDEPASVLLERIAATTSAKVRTLRGRPRVLPERPSAIPEPVPADWASLPDGVWSAPEDPDGQAAMVWLTAVLRAWGESMPEREARLAALLCQQPRLFTAILPAADATQWSRLVGNEARPLPAQVRSFRPAINSHWGRAIKGMRARGDLVEAGLGDNVTWALGSGAASIETAGWADGRARFVVAHLRAHGMASVLPLLEPSAQEFVDARAA